MARRIERKLTTILCADVQDYSRLMDRDEVGTLARLQQYRAAIASHIVRSDGRVVNTWGDGLIAEFPSVVEAVRAAAEIQQEVRARNAALDASTRLDFRIGINLGDVMVEDGDLYGEGVNVAARLQTLAEPGGIVVSGTVHDLVRGKLTLAFDYVGEQQLKNIAEPVATFRVRVGGQPAPRRAAAPSPKRPTPVGGVKRLTAVSAVVIAFLLALNLLTSPQELWFHWPALAMALVIGIRWASRL